MRRLLPLTLALLLAACGEGEPLIPPDARLPDGGRYRGEVVDGLLQGEGRIDYPNGSFYIGTFEAGLLSGPGIWQGPSGDRYEGEFAAGLFDGVGVFRYAEGALYEGQFRLGRMEGKGVFSQDGMRYEGEFLRDRYHGHGRLTYPDGQVYEGQFAGGQPHGEGIRRDGADTYQGHFVNGVLDGPGSFVSADGERYEGGFANDRMEGQGRYESASGDHWSGTFSQGELTGQGQHIGSDGSRYEGGFRGWRYHGQGRLELPDGSHYQGGFRFGQFHGKGERVLADGRREAGTWRSGRRAADEQGQPLADPLEVGLLNQGRLLDEALGALPASTPATELYGLIFAGDGQQSVFLRESDFVSRLLRERYHAHGQVTLVNHRDHLADRPLATRENLRRAIEALARASGPEDLLFFYFTSHGSADHQLAVVQPRLTLEDLPAADLARLLQPLADRNKVVIISACYSGGFIEPLKDERTLVMTAARADRVSFGCSEESDFTYFGRALFAEAMSRTRDLAEAFELAKAHVAEQEEAEQYQASEPQLWAPEGVLAHWRQLQDTRPADLDD
ncbi:peptidase C13 [Stutzerimonas nosocomialis]|uniref:C13 family peptidase n=1 Tax=Stutzerimonas nosocomialis TaxID=1056496 RepID=UPI001108941C|nr:C13 family peptidase [Stutzerimonas nosocomialis]TLX58074.1 peptidase C13 [Stutzerimonas nosocomialis]